MEVAATASVHNELPIQVNEPQVEPIQEPVNAVVKKKSKKRQSSLMQHFVVDKRSKV